MGTDSIRFIRVPTFTQPKHFETGAENPPALKRALRKLYERSTNPPPPAPDSPPFDLLRVPALGRLLRWRHARTLLQVPLFAVGVLMILHGLFGPTLAPKNLATTLTWVQFRGALVLVLLLAGNFFCMACPFMLPRQL